MTEKNDNLVTQLNLFRKVSRNLAFTSSGYYGSNTFFVHLSARIVDVDAAVDKIVRTCTSFGLSQTKFVSGQNQNSKLS